MRLPGSRILVTYRKSQKNLKGKHNQEDYCFCIFFFNFNVKLNYLVLPDQKFSVGVLTYKLLPEDEESLCYSISGISLQEQMWIETLILFTSDLSLRM
jgi:hypothetical protein